MKQLLVVIALVATLAGFGHAQGNNRKCAANGEYCQLASDCCSGSCLSFSYKCVPVPPGPAVGVTLVPEPIDTANRFGEDGDTQKTCAKNGEYCQTHSDCCSSSCLTFSYKCVPLNPPAPGTELSSWPSPVQQPPPAASKPTSGSNSGSSSTGDLGNRVGEDQPGSTASINYITSPPKRCAAIGEYCQTSSDCCSGACLSTRYKCVSSGSGPADQPAPTNNNNNNNNGEDVGNRFDGSTDTTTPRKCAAVGEYCLVASDCCSLSCLSFKYQCVNNYPLSGQSVQQSSSTFTENRFGGSNSGNNNRQCTANGKYCFHGGECCSGACYKSFCATQIQLGVPESVLTDPAIAGGPRVQVNSVDELITRFGGGGGAQVADSNASASGHRANIATRNGALGKQCVVVGEGCSRHEDCCSTRCHSYRRKCVT
ncbi:uncharacterized protein LOC129747253 isoform X1 [Uranotaenia lowii]|uniref:uncharacterized protein LOC129747253 isoform X1 n=1 Tax=Uranotaenia lowii TaxID=190385 RepID=UPI00247A4B41|nr:uncharacterized protein LOC129747253 isoform X1 [Uranotaenia lowii]